MSAPVLTPFVDAAPCPRVEVFFEDFDPGTTHVTVYRLAGGREFRVRGAVMAATAGSFARIDFEVPLNVPVTYRAEQFDAAGLSLGFTPSATLAGVVSTDTWMHNPLNPQGSVKVTLLDSVARQLSRPVPGEISYPLGRRVGVMLSQPRQGIRGIVFDVVTESLEDADRVQALIGSYTQHSVPVICVRTGADVHMRVGMPLFLGVLDITEEDQNVRWGGQEVNQRMQGDEVDPPIPGLFIPLLRRKDLNAAFATRAAMNGAALTRGDINRLYEYAGLAG